MAKRLEKPLGNKVYKVQVLDENSERVLFETGPFPNLGAARSSASYYRGKGHYHSYRGRNINYQTSILVLEGEWAEA